MTSTEDAMQMRDLLSDANASRARWASARYADWRAASACAAAVTAAAAAACVGTLAVGTPTASQSNGRSCFGAMTTQTRSMVSHT